MNAMHSSTPIAAANSGPKAFERAALGAQRLVGAADVGDHEHVEHHHRAGVDHDLAGGEELGVQEQEQHRQRDQVRDQREHRVEGVAQHHDAERARRARRCRRRRTGPARTTWAGAYSPSRRSGVCSGGSASSISFVKIRSRAAVVGELVVVAHRDRVERAGHLAVAAEDAARHVDLVDRRVALAGRDLVVGRVLGGHHADALGRAGRGAERAAHALLEARCPRSGAACGGRGSAGRPASSPRGTRSVTGPSTTRPKVVLQAAQRLAEHAVDGADAAGLGAAVDRRRGALARSSAIRSPPARSR